MRRTLLALVAIVLVVAGYILVKDSSPRQSQPAPSARIGTVAPDFTLQSYDGETVTLSHLRGKVVLVNFWATWCPPCRTEKPTMETLYRTFSGRDDFELLAVNVEEDAARALATYLQQYDYTFPILLDSHARVQELFRVYRFPESFILDRNGIVVEHVIGARDWSDPKIIAYLTQLLNE